jgi:hypothetical protein
VSTRTPAAFEEWCDNEWPWSRPVGPVKVGEGGGMSQEAAFQFPRLTPTTSRRALERMWRSVGDLPVRLARAEWPGLLDGMEDGGAGARVIHPRFALDISSDDDWYRVTVARPGTRRTRAFAATYRRRRSAQLAAFDYLVSYGCVQPLAEPR